MKLLESKVVGISTKIQCSEIHETRLVRISFM